VRHCDDLFGADPDTETPVLLFEERVLDHLIDDLILELPVLFLRQRGGAVLLPVLFGGELHALLILGHREFFAVDAEDDVAAGTEDAHHLTDGEPPHKRDGEDIKTHLALARIVRSMATSNSVLRGGVKGISLKTTTHKLKRTGSRVI